MKFNSDLDFYQNLEVRRNSRPRYGRLAPMEEYRTLNAEDRTFLMTINERLKQLEEQFLPMMNAKGEELQARVANPADWMQDFNLDIVFTFYLREDDPEYEEDDDNILMQIRESTFDYNLPDRDDHGFGITSTYYCGEYRDDYEEGQHHCYMYHELYAYSYLDWSDLLRIGDIYVDIKIEEQSGMLPVLAAITTQGK